MNVEIKLSRRRRPDPTTEGNQSMHKRDRQVLKAAVVVLCLLAVGCSAGPRRISDANVETITYLALVKMLERQSASTVLVDVRPAQHFAEGHIPGAINIPISDLRRGDARLADARRIVVYSGRSSDMLSRAAAKTLLRLRYRNVYDFRGGLRIWQTNYRRVEAAENTENTDNQ
jgi:rhodanese-related sulfurtransferase